MTATLCGAGGSARCRAHERARPDHRLAAQGADTRHGADLERWRGPANLWRPVDPRRDHRAERYVAGVVAAELLPRWPVESLGDGGRRTFVHLMAYGRTGRNPTTRPPMSAARSLAQSSPQPVLKATEATKGQLLVFKGKPIAAHITPAPLGGPRRRRRCGGEASRIFNRSRVLTSPATGSTRQRRARQPGGEEAWGGSVRKVR